MTFISDALIKLGAVPDPNQPIQDPIKWKCVFIIGPAGSGKSTICNQLYLKHLEFVIVDPDDMKVKNPEYDPEDPQPIHEWSKLLSEKKFIETVTNKCGTPMLVEATGKSWDNVARKIWLAQALGYTTYLVYVEAPLEVSIHRNRLRGCSGDRYVDENIVLEQNKNVQHSVEQLKTIVDKYLKVRKYTKRDLAEAKASVAKYPPPLKQNPLCAK